MANARLAPGREKTTERPDRHPPSTLERPQAATACYRFAVHAAISTPRSTLLVPPDANLNRTASRSSRGVEHGQSPSPRFTKTEKSHATCRVVIKLLHPAGSSSAAAPRRAEHPHRGRHRRAGRTDRRGQGPAHRALRGRARDDPSRTRRATDRRGADRVLPLDTVIPKPNCYRCYASSGSGSCPTRRSGTGS